MRVAILTVSDRASRGERADQSADAIRRTLAPRGVDEVGYRVVPDEVEAIAAALRELAEKADVVLTTGGTGVSPRDVTPEATHQVIERELPGYGEAMRRESFRITPHAVISRATAGVVGRTLIVNLPGSPKAAAECLAVVQPALEHTVAKIQGDPSECA